MEIRGTVPCVAVVFAALSLGAASGFAGPRDNPPRPAPSPRVQTFNSASGFSKPTTPPSRAAGPATAATPRVGTSANPMAPGGKLTSAFTTATGKPGKTPPGTPSGRTTGTQFAPRIGANQTGMPSGLVTQSRQQPRPSRSATPNNR
jgi:hypothetical protein